MLQPDFVFEQTSTTTGFEWGRAATVTGFRQSRIDRNRKCGLHKSRLQPDSDSPRRNSNRISTEKGSTVTGFRAKKPRLQPDSDCTDRNSNRIPSEKGSTATGFSPQTPQQQPDLRPKSRNSYRIRTVQHRNCNRIMTGKRLDINRKRNKWALYRDWIWYSLQTRSLFFYGKTQQ